MDPAKNSKEKTPRRKSTTTVSFASDRPSSHRRSGEVQRKLSSPIGDETERDPKKPESAGILQQNRKLSTANQRTRSEGSVGFVEPKDTARSSRNKNVRKDRKPRQLYNPFIKVHEIRILMPPDGSVDLIPTKEKVKDFASLRYQDTFTLKHHYADTIDLLRIRMSNMYTISVPNKFSTDQSGEAVSFYMGEKLSCEKTWLLTSARRTMVLIITPTGRLVAKLYKPRTCRLPFLTPFPCFLSLEYLLFLPDNRLLGTIVKDFSILSPKFSVKDSSGEPLFTVVPVERSAMTGNICPLWLCRPSYWNVFDADMPQQQQQQGKEHQSKVPMAVIVKECTFPCSENVWKLKIFPSNVPEMAKNRLMVLCAMYVMDTLHYRRFATLWHSLTWLAFVAAIGFALYLLFYTIVVRPYERSE